MAQVAQDDLLLLRSYAANADAEAFAELVKRYAGMVFATARRVTGDATAAEDVSQDCFLRLAHSSAAVTGSLPAWLHRTSLNRSLELVRSERSRRRRELRAAAMQNAAGATVPADSDSAQLIARVDEALASLPDDLRIVVTEHFLCGRTQSELALSLGIDQSTVSRRIEKGVCLLRDRLSGEADSPMVAALPVFLAGLGQAPAPAGLKAALIKIGLSGVRGDGLPEVSSSIGRTTGKTVAARFLWSRALIGVLAVAAAAVVYRAVPAGVPDHETMVRFDALPPAVRATFTDAAAADAFGRVEQKKEGNRTIYEADVTIAGKPFEIRVAEDGTLIWKKPG